MLKNDNIRYLDKQVTDRLNVNDLSGSCISTESSLHQIAPYIGKIKSTIAVKLIEHYTRPGSVILDPFAGSGTIPLEALILKRHAIANDLNPYAISLIKAKMFPEPSEDFAKAKVRKYIQSSKKMGNSFNVCDIPDWVKKFYHPLTLKEIVIFNKLLIENDEFFLHGCFLGILHHQRPGFLSYPASHLVPYLRTKLYPLEKYPHLYEYRDLESRINRKIERSFRRFTMHDKKLQRIVLQKNACKLKFKNDFIDAIITSPPYMNTLSYARDNRLRLWFLGYNNYKKMDKMSPNNINEFKQLMKSFLINIYDSLKINSVCVFILGDINRTSKCLNTAIALNEVVDDLGDFKIDEIIKNDLPIKRRTRKNCSRTKSEWIIVFRKCKS